MRAFGSGTFLSPLARHPRHTVDRSRPAMPPAAAPAPAAAAYPQPSTRFQIPGGAAGLGAADDDLFSFRRDGPFDTSAKFVDATRNAGDATAPRYQIQCAVVLAITCDLDEAATVTMLKDSNALQHELSASDCSA